MKPMNPKSISPTTASATADANNKKLKQSRLPFKLLTGTPVKEASTPDTRKRKLSAGAEETRPAKRKVSEVKENLDDVILLGDDTSDLIIEGKDDSVVAESETLESTPADSGTKTNKSKVNKKSTEKEVLLIKFPVPKKKKVSKQLIVEEKSEEVEIPKKSTHKRKKKIVANASDKETEKVETDEVSDVKSIDEIEVVSPKENEKEAEEEEEEAVEEAEEVSDLKPMEIDSDDEVVCLEEETEEKEETKNEEVSTPKRVSKRISESPVISSKKLKNKNESENKDSFASPKASVSSSPVSVNKKLTPGQLKKKVEAEKRKEERLQLLQKAKEEREKKLQEEKEQRQQKELLRKKERDEKEDARKKEKEEKEQKRLAELEQRNEEKRVKDEERKKKDEQREEERRKKELEKEEEENKKKRASRAFTKFFLQAKPEPKKVDDSSTDSADVVVQHQNFMPFRIKGDMKLAPPVRRVLGKEHKKCLEEIVLNGKTTDKMELYLSVLKKGLVAPKKGTKTWEVDEDEVILIEELGETSHTIEENKPKERHRAKFLKFADNRRPAYYGTWRKDSKTIKARRPFATDSIFDYENDSDDEWEEEEPGGESLHGSDDEKDKESDDDYEVDNEFFVPHGYLSDEENNEEDENEEDNRPETQKAKLKILQQEFADEMKKKTEKIKPRLIGCIWINKDGSQPNSCPNVIWDMLQVRSMIFDLDVIKKFTAPKPVEVAPAQDENVSNKRVNITEDEVPNLIRLIHGNLNNKHFLVNEFREFRAKKHEGEKNFRVFSNVSVTKKIRELGEYKACPEEGPMLNKLCWYISPEKLIEYNLKDLTLPNTWNYILPPKENKRIIENKEVSTATITENVLVPSQTTTKAAITKFTKVLSKDDIKKQFNSPSTSKSQKSSSPAPSSSIVSATTPTTGNKNKVKKRVPLLMSVPRGQEISEKAKNSLIDKFLKTVSSKDIKDEIEKQMMAEEVIILD